MTLQRRTYDAQYLRTLVRRYWPRRHHDRLARAVIRMCVREIRWVERQQ